MKKLFFSAMVIACMTSCTTVLETARTEKASSQILSSTVADLDVSKERVTSTLEVTKEIRRGGSSNIYRAAEAKALKGTGADLLVEPEYTTEKKWTLFGGSKIKRVTVTGRPAKFTNFHSLNDSVWCNPLFRAKYGKK